MSDTYESPDFTITAQHNERIWDDDDGGRVERVYVNRNAVTFTGGLADSTHQGGTHTLIHLPTTKRKAVRPAPVVLALLCLLLLVGISVLFKLYVAAVLNENQLMDKLKEQKKNSSYYVSSNYCQFGEEDNSKGERAEWWRVQCHCYYMSTEKKNWTESQKDCERRGAQLLMIKDKNKHDVLSQLIKRGDHEDSWIGLETVDTKGWKYKWQWVDGSELTYRSWKVGIYMNHEKNSKGFTDPHGSWNYSTNGLKHWICERSYTDAAFHMNSEDGNSQF